MEKPPTKRRNPRLGKNTGKGRNKENHGNDRRKQMKGKGQERNRERGTSRYEKSNREILDMDVAPLRRER